MKRIELFYIVLVMALISGCSSAPATAASTATSGAAMPAGWATHTSQQCEYSISYPSEMQVTDQSPYSQTLRFKSADPDAGARNFIYVSVVGPQTQSMVQAGAYQNEVYNYDPAETDVLLNMQVGESRSSRADANAAPGFTYQRQADTTISGQAARTYENAQPWEFPAGTKEIRHYVSANGCTYLIGGYVDAAGSNQPGAISEDLFHQIRATVQLMP